MRQGALCETSYIDFYGRRTRHTGSLRIMHKLEPSEAGNLRLSRKTDIPYRNSSENVSGKAVSYTHLTLPTIYSV